MSSVIRICHVVGDLRIGGAERMLAKLLALDSAGHTVVALGGTGPMEQAISNLNVPVHVLGLSSSLVQPLREMRVLRLVHQLRPDLVVGWMYHGNLAALVVSWRCRARLVWNIRHSLHDPSLEKPMLRALIRAGAVMSGFPECTIYNSRLAAQQHEAIGYGKARRAVLPNGFDTTRFRPDPNARPAVRAELGLRETAFLVGQVARLHPMKNHMGLLEAAARVPSLHLMLVGRGVDVSEALARRASAPALAGRVHRLGERNDVARLLAACDWVVSPSAWGEGFPNAIGEAMACGVPVIATDVGDSAKVVADTGLVVPPSDQGQLTAALRRAYFMPPARRRQLGICARARVEHNYSLPMVAARYQKIFRASATQGGSA
ncbi:MAG: glycosyltransferase [Aquisalimonadaceae bacterium]